MLVYGAFGVSVRTPLLKMRAQLKGDSSLEFNQEWKAPLIGQMEELEKLLSPRKEQSPTKVKLPVLNNVGATLPWAQALIRQRAAKKPKKKAADDAKALFKKYDVDKNGNLSVAETAAMAPADTDRFCNAAVAVMCADKDGGNSLNEDEFAATFKSTEFTACYLEFEPHCHRHDSYEIETPEFLKVSKNITAKFRSADTNKNGFLTVEEFSPLAKEMNPDVANPHCFAEVAVRCADEDGSGNINLVEFIDMYSPGTLMNDFEHCMTLNDPACDPSAGQIKKTAVPSNLLVSYTPELCKDLFVYEFERDLCLNLQKKVCGVNCTLRYNTTDNQTQRCGDVQTAICKVPKPLPAPKPLSHNGYVPNNTLNTTVTVCISFPTTGKDSVWVARESFGFPKPLATKLSYLDCTQIKAYRGMDIGFYSGATKLAHHVCQERDELVMVGFSLKDRRNKAVVSYSFKDEEMRRPILCHTAPDEPTMKVSVYTRNWHAFSNPKNLDGELSYLQCEVLLMDHDDLLKQKENLQFTKGNSILGHIEVGPLPTLYLLRSGSGTDLRAKAHNLGHLKYP
jgi:Ca2+-binding EF-hand superfamily protein